MLFLILTRGLFTSLTHVSTFSCSSWRPTPWGCWVRWIHTRIFVEHAEKCQEPVHFHSETVTTKPDVYSRRVFREDFSLNVKLLLSYFSEGIAPCYYFWCLRLHVCPQASTREAAWWKYFSSSHVLLKKKTGKICLEIREACKKKQTKKSTLINTSVCLSPFLIMVSQWSRPEGAHTECVCSYLC